MNNPYPKTVPEVLTELKEELKEFLTTRVAMLRLEMGEKLHKIKVAAPMLVVGLLLLITAWLVFTGFLVTIIAQAFLPSPWAYVLSFIIVVALYAIAGGVAAMSGWKQLKQAGLKPERTIRVLEQDRIWIQTEAKTQL